MEKIAAIFYASGFLYSESIKTLRTNLMFSGDEVRAVALTSYSADEGKSTISFQLAAALAQNGKRVLLMDADLRRSVLARQLKVKGKVEGLSHCLSGMSKVGDLIFETDLPGLFIMFAGVRVANPAEVLGSTRFKKLVPALKGTFDYIIIDTAPLGQVIDCAVMAPELDGILLVIDSTQNSYKMERRIKQQLEKSGGKLLGCVLHRVDFRDKGGYYGKDSEYGYGER